MGGYSLVVDREVIDKIISIEWDMFTVINEGESRADCQDDKTTFEGMRAAQFYAWSGEAAAFYLDDLETALRENRNLVEEKYIYMMEKTEPAMYNELLSRLRLPSEEARAVAHKISDLLLEQTRVMFEDYPYISGQGRPLYSEFDHMTTSVETYQLCELLTYSEKTLNAYLSHLVKQTGEGISLAKTILENTIRFYGFGSLEEAEEKTKTRANKQGIQMTFGCCAGGVCGEDN